ncbi:hypothetical protein KEJ39_05535 [Candidatus Bathyarchaeota archaeon]|nr:hypothetical protein [Candidatus Bathyarchaeota archaeon]
MKEPNLQSASPYLRAIAERRLRDCEKELEQLRGALTNSEWNRGYLKALEGLLLTLKSNDGRYLYLQRLKMDDKTVRRLKEDFRKHSSSELHADYDRGYFAALTDYASTLEAVKPWLSQVQDAEVADDSGGEATGEAEA